jgi:hypothetical protein
MINAERRPELGRTPLAAKILVGLCLVLFAAIVAFVIYAIIELGSAINSSPKTDELRNDLKVRFPSGTALTEVTSYLDSKPGRYDVKAGSEVDQYFETLGLTHGAQRSQVASVVDAVVPVEGGFLAFARLLFYFDGEGRLVRLVVCQGYDCRT